MAVFLIAFLAVVVLALVAFPVVGLAALPVVAVLVVAVLAWAGIVITRGPRELPERTTSPNEPDELGR